MDQILIGLPDFAIKKVMSYFPIILEVEWTGKAVCPRCRSSSFRIKDTFCDLANNKIFDVAIGRSADEKRLKYFVSI